MKDPTFPNLPPAEFAARFGYGISTARPATATPNPQDRNEKNVRAMSVAERVAYYQALYGKGIVLDRTGNLTSSITTDDSSCDGRGEATRPIRRSSTAGRGGSSGCRRRTRVSSTS